MKKIFNPLIFTVLALLFSGLGYGQETEGTVKKLPKVYEAEPVYIILFIVCLLALIILILARVFILVAKNKMENDNKENAGNASTLSFPILAIIFSLFPFTETFSQSNVAKETVYFSEQTVQVLLVVLALEIILILYLAIQIQSFLRKTKSENLQISLVESVAAPKKSWLEKFYKQNTEEELAQLDLGHNYDGIKELDNNVPIWWKFGFAFSIVFAIIYLYSYHVSYSKPLQQEELKIELANAEKAHQKYLLNAANNIDENTVTMLSKEDIETGKSLFIKPGACATCHGENGSGIVNGLPGIGPNLTDEFWIHKGDIQSIFYSIKYGWPEKGMKSWKDDYSPKQIAQLSSYVKSLQGSKPQPAKDKEGILFVEDSVQAVPTVNN